MTKPVDCLFFFTKHPQLGVSCCSGGHLGFASPPWLSLLIPF